MKKILFTSLLIIVSLTTNAQDYALNSEMNYNENNIDNNSSKEIVPLLEQTKYTYKYKGDDVLVIFSENEHIEYFNDKKYFIKSTITWTAEDECYMTLQESNLPRFPFKKGIKLKMKIQKVKRGYIYYESTLGGRSWTGKMKKLN
ncbi:hypothetical protein MC378_13070 [Polaribacter sp. MSW13]|uniref:Beta-lactamase-inhibitor-like PepSY-like domain-containing protein n=1 Tax=Polaribacter marinus TaxID=2916838 RepID=A0A9X1VQ11_9FLAO|nr:hypothetical protein [Polaribacter marinus]MCI2230103.1 hypothetical protein [Polaribacter marinus]